MSAVPNNNRKSGKAKLNFTDKKSEETNSELYIHVLGMNAVKKKTTADG